MSRIRKYAPGSPINTIARLSRELEDGRYVYLFDRPCHPGWIASMRYNTVMGFIRRGSFRVAEIEADWIEQNGR